MKVLRWRLWVLMTLVLVCALGIKAVLVVQARRAAIERRAWLLSEFNSPPRTPAVEADLVGLLGDSDAAVRFQALRMLDRIDATAPAMIPPLMALLGDHDPVFPRSQALRVLDRIGVRAPAMIPPLIELLEIETAEVAFGNSRGFRHGSRLYPAEVLKRFQFPLPVIAARLAPALVSPDAYVRAQALAVLLDAAGPPGAAVTPEPVIALLLALLADVDPRNRLRAAEILARLAPDARRRAGAVLLGQLGDPPDCWALLATVSLARFEPEARTAAAILAGRLDASDRNARCTGLYLLGRLGPPARSAVPAIVRAMVTPDAGEQWPQLGLGGLSPLQDVDRPWDHIGVLPAGNGSDSPSNLAAMAALVLGRIGPEAGAEAVALLIGMVREGDEARQWAAARALGDLGPRAVAAFPDLLALVERTTREIHDRPRHWRDWDMAAPLTRTLYQVLPGDDPRLVAALVRLFETGTWMQRFDAAFVLGYLEPPPLAALPALIRAAHSEAQGIRCSAATVLGRYAEPKRDEAIPPLLAAFRDENEYVRFAAAKSLSHFGVGGPDVIPAAIAWLGNAGLYFRSGAVEILGRYGPAARAALPALQGRRSDPDVFVREAVAKVIPLIDQPAPAP